MAVVKGAQEALGPWASAGRFAVSALCFSPFLPAALRRPAVARAGAELGLLAAVGYASQARACVAAFLSFTKKTKTYLLLYI